MNLDICICVFQRKKLKYFRLLDFQIRKYSWLILSQPGENIDDYPSGLISDHVVEVGVFVFCILSSCLMSSPGQ